MEAILVQRKMQHQHLQRHWGLPGGYWGVGEVIVMKSVVRVAPVARDAGLQRQHHRRDQSP